MTNAPVLETLGLTKRYRGKPAVQDLSLRVSRGEIYGFLGLNGAGKTTTIRMILGLARPTRGRVAVLGRRYSPGDQAILSRVGALTEAGFYGNLTVRENLALAASLTGVRAKGRLEQTLDLVGMAAEARKIARTLSTGMRQRLRLARALVHEPELLVLDEPATGLDPAGIREVRLLIKSLAEEKGVTVFMSSHILAEVQQVATRIGILHQGSLVEELDQAELQLRSRSYLEIAVSDTAKATWILEESLAIRNYAVTDGQTLRLYQGLDRAAEINQALVTAGVGVGRLALQHESLEDHFIKLTGGDAGETRN